MAKEFRSKARTAAKSSLPILFENSLLPHRAQATLSKISNNINKTYTGLISVLQVFQKCIA